MPTLYEQRRYSVIVGQMAEVTRLYSTLGWPALEAGGFSKNLIGYFISDTGELHQLVHLWRFDSDDARREFWKKLFADEDFMVFARQLRPLLRAQSNQLLVGPSSFSVETNIHNEQWWSGPAGMWASRASGLSTCPQGGVELMGSRLS